MSGRVEIVIGCMFSGKSTELIRRISRYEAIGHQTLLVNHILMVASLNKLTWFIFKIKTLFILYNHPYFE